MEERETQNGFWGGESSEEWADMGGIIAIQGHGVIWTWTAARAYVCVHGPNAIIVCFDVLDS